MDLIRIVEYGEHPHQKGMQRVTFEVARRLEDNFHSLRGLLSRRFGGLPVYVGHPDDPEYAGQPGHTDTRAHGWIVDLAAKPDGLYGDIKWAKSGRELIDNANYKFFSPRWVMRSVGNGVFEPVKLLSVGLTNTPNIPGDVIANSAPAVVSAGGSVVAVGPVSGREGHDDHCDSFDRIAANAPYVSRPSITAKLGLRRDVFGHRQAIVDAVHSRMADTGEDFASAWSNLKRTRQDLFA
jgi:hypothetical protein